MEIIRIQTSRRQPRFCHLHRRIQLQPLLHSSLLRLNKEMALRTLSTSQSRSISLFVSLNFAFSLCFSISCSLFMVLLKSIFFIHYFSDCPLDCPK
ncbi:hypothetical protein ACSBR2_042472 [Camellia fascicularis]